jgi:single-strand DNA-binding protein
MLKLLVIGNLGKDATITNVNGKNVVHFSVAHTEKYKDVQGVLIEKTTWVECSYWTERAIAPYLKKGTQVYAEGTPDVISYTTQDGRVGATLRLRVASVQLLATKEGASEASQSTGGNIAASQPQTAAPAYQPSSSPSPSVVAESEIADDLPF